MIPEQFIKTTEHYERYKQFMTLLSPDYYDELCTMDLENILEDSLTGERWDILLSSTFAQEYTDLIKEKEYFRGCPFKIYQEDFHHRKRNFLKDNPDTLDIDFIKSEYENLDLPIFDLTLPNIVKSIQHSITRTKEFLDEEVAKTTYFISVSYDDSGKPVYVYSRKNLLSSISEQYNPNYSDNSKIDRVAYLEILGVIDFIKKKTNNISETRLASVLSGFTGTDAPTLKRYLIGIHHEGDLNNPLKNPVKVKEIKNKLQKLGVKLTDQG